MTTDRPARRIAFCVEYDGTDYCGWQVQPGGRASIQGELQAALADVLGHPVVVDGASRTDAGVHARDQRAAVTTSHPIAVAGLVKAVNRRLPAAIAVGGAREVDAAHQPRFAFAGKRYRYQLYISRLRHPLLDRFAWRVPWSLDLEAMGAAAAPLIGTHDFTSFAASDGTHRSAVRTVNAIVVEGTDTDVTVTVEGTAFLKQMVRNLVGSLVDVGRGHRPVDALTVALRGRDRSLAGPTAPACGLCLEQMLERPDVEAPDAEAVRS